MCCQNRNLGYIFTAAGAALLLSLLLPRCFWTALAGLALILIGCLLLRN
jgi:hypothetical protein